LELYNAVINTEK